nr:MAG TPA: hypothetical protein [Caudoviricetes sp.]
MLEIKVQLSATDDLIAAVRNLAAALDGKTPDHTAAINTAPINTPINPTPARVAQPTATPAAMPAIAETAATPAAMPAIAETTATPAAMPAIAETTAAPAVPTSAPQYTLDMIATAGSALIDAGKMDQLMGLLGKFGVASLTELAPESYGAVANELRALGAAI